MSIYASPKLSCQISQALSSAVAMNRCAKMLTLTLTTGRNSPQHNFDIGEDFAVAESEPVACHRRQETEHGHAHQHLQLSAKAKGSQCISQKPCPHGKVFPGSHSSMQAKVPVRRG